MDSAIEVRYAGVTVGRATHVRDWTDAGAFIGFAEPLPTGTRVEVRADGERKPATIEQVIESADPAVAGMRVRFIIEGVPVVVAAEASVAEGSGALVPEASGANLAEPGESGPNAAGAAGGKRRRRRR